MRTLLVVLTTLALLPAAVSGEIPEIMGYQGRVTDNSGIPVPNDAYTMRFRIYNAANGGTMLWDSEELSVVLSGGIFNVLLGAAGQPTLDLPFDQDYWLLVTFEGQDITPRQNLVSVGYAYMASGVVPGTEVSGTVPGGAAFTSTNTSTSGLSYGLVGESHSAAGRGVRGIASSTSGQTYGVHGSASSPSGYGVYSEGNARVDGQLEAQGFKMASGAVDGYVLKSDANGVGTWQAGGIMDDGDWEIVGNDMSSVPSGNVGIGTTTPGGKLHVTASAWGQPHLYLEHPTYGHTRVLQAAGGLLFRNYGATGTNIAYGFRDSTNSSLMVMRADGNIGIGVGTPLEKLVVGGTAQVQGFRMTPGSVDGHVLKTDASGVGTWQPDSVGDGDWEVAGDDMYASVSGNVGIGTTGPSGRLHVAASTWTQPNLLLENPTYGQTGVLQASGGLLFRNYGATGTDLAYGFRDSANTSLMILRADGNVGIGVGTPSEKLAVGGTAQVQGFKMSPGAHVGWVLTSDAAGTGTWQPSGGASGDGDWYIDGTDMYSIPSGNVGVGVGTPSEKLDVGGTAQVQGFKMPTGAANGYALKSDGSGAGTWQPDNVDDSDWEIVGNDMASVPSGNVGIGVAAPSEKLDVGGTAQIQGFRMPTGAAAGFVLKSDAFGAGTWQLESPDADWQVTGIDMYAIPPRNVGIGISNPAQKLHVAGSARLGAGESLEFGDSNTRVYESSGDMTVTADGDLYLQPDDDLYIGTDGASPWARFDNGLQRLGLGTTSPNARLHAETSADAVALGGVNTTPAGLTYGVYGQASSPSGYGVYSNGNAGVAGDFSVTQAADVDGSLTVDGAATLAGGLSVQHGTQAVYGRATNAAGVTYGVYGEAASGAGFGVYSDGNAKVEGGLQVTQSATVGDSLGVSGGLGAQHPSRAIYGEATAASGIAYGGRFQAASPSGRGLYGLAASTSGSPIGVYGACNSTLGFGVYYTGGLAGTGSKSCVVRTSEGPTLLYCQESPECWFEDFGEGRLINGRAHVELDPLFLETVTTDESNPMKVFVQLHDETCRGVAVKKGRTGFDVVELQNGRSSGTFDYRVVAKRKGFEQKRLDFCNAAKTDPYLYPEFRDRATE